jgi:two-component sensor histidine kinase
MEALPIFLSVVQPNHKIIFANKVFRNLFGNPENKRCHEHLFGLDTPCEGCKTGLVLRDMQTYEWEWLGPNGRTYYVFDIPYVDMDGSTLVFEFGMDITERSQAEAKIQNLNRELEERVAMRTAQLAESEATLREILYEKEALLKEAHHRIKNNLQIVYSILNLQLPYIEDEKAQEIFKESKNRVFSMAMVHEKLYLSESLAKISLPDYISSLLENLFNSYGVSNWEIALKLDIEDLDFGIDTGFPCALIINELVSNSLKHGFSRHCALPREKIIEVSLLQKEDKFELMVRDNGVGLPENYDMESSQSLGLKLVRVLVKQLNGIISINREPAEIRISFEPISK